MKRINGKVYFECENPKIVNGISIVVSGPHYRVSAPWGIALESTAKYEWFLYKPLTDKDLEDPNISEICKILKEISLGDVVNYIDQPKRFIVRDSEREFKSLNGAIRFVVKMAQDRRIV